MVDRVIGPNTFTGVSGALNQLNGLRNIDVQLDGAAGELSPTPLGPPLHPSASVANTSGPRAPSCVYSSTSSAMGRYDAFAVGSTIAYSAAGSNVSNSGVLDPIARLAAGSSAPTSAEPSMIGRGMVSATPLSKTITHGLLLSQHLRLSPTWATTVVKT
jgi:hypothetical protein